MKANIKNAHDNLVHAGEFTKIENTAIVYVLRGWFATLSGIPGALEASDDVWATTTVFEHFTSLLKSDAATRTKESLAVSSELQQRAKDSQDRLDSILGAHTNEDERINTLTDQIVADVLKKLGF
ncbi:MAG TPA: hypothetical protein VGY75_10845 [Candidatus Udaeobacter sp.]|jgi:hypothetical protein|nr:hypothetical protein [Candidatus Udaeobacter sp.]